MLRARSHRAVSTGRESEATTAGTTDNQPLPPSIAPSPNKYTARTRRISSARVLGNEGLEHAGTANHKLYLNFGRAP